MNGNLKYCQTCLSDDRALSPMNSFKSLLHQINLRFKKMEGGICWECRNLIVKCSKFKSQARFAQATLKNPGKLQSLKSLSSLSYSTQDFCDNQSVVPVNTAPVTVKLEPVDVEEYESENNAMEVQSCHENVGKHCWSDLPKITLVESIKDVHESTAQLMPLPNREKSNTNTSSQNGEMSKETKVLSAQRLVIKSTSKVQERKEMCFNKITVKNFARMPADNSLKQNELPVKFLSQNKFSQDRNKLQDHSENNTTNNDNTSLSNYNTANILLASNKNTINKSILSPQPNNTVVKNNSAGALGCAHKRVIQKPNTASCSANGLVESSKMDNTAVKVRTSVAIKQEAIDLFRTQQTTSKEGINTRQETAKVINLDVWKKTVLLVLDRIRSHKYAAQFEHPIEDSVAPGYSDVVRRPVDLAGIKRKIKLGIIRTTAEFQRDLLLMLTNSLMYNSSSFHIHSMTKSLFEEVKYQLDVLLMVHANTSLPYQPFPRPKRRLNHETNTPFKKSRLLTPKVERVTPKVERVTPKVERVAPKVDKVKRNVEKITPIVQKTTPRPEQRIAPNSVTRIIKQEIIMNSKNASTNPKSAQINSTLNDIVMAPSTTSQICNINTAQLKAKVRTEIQEAPRRISLRNKIKKEKQEIAARNAVILIPDEKPTAWAQRAIKKEKLNEETQRTNKRTPNVKKEKKETKSNSNEDLVVAIATKSLRDLTAIQANNLKKHLEEQILSIAFDSRNFAPRFRGQPIISDGVVKLWCENKQTLEWLKETVQKIDSTKNLTVKMQKEVRKIRAGVFIPGINPNFEVIKRLLVVQNLWAHFDCWTLYCLEQRGESMFLTLGIPVGIIPALLKKERMLSYRLGSVRVHFYHENGGLSDESSPFY